MKICLTIKVRLQSQDMSKPIYRGTIHCFSTILKREGVCLPSENFDLIFLKAKGLFKGMSSPMMGVAAVNSLLFGVYGGLLHYQMENNKDQSQTVPNLNQIFLAGSASGIVTSFVTTPMELVKIRLQTQGIDGLSQIAVRSQTETKTPGPMQLLKEIWKLEGIRGLYRGLGVTLIRETPSYGAYFVAYEVLCRMLAPEGTDPKDISGVRLMLAGGLGGIVGWSVTYPFDVAKTIIQSDTRTNAPHIRWWTCMRDLFQQRGIKALFNGFGATVIRAFPTNVAILGTFHVTMSYFRRFGLTNASQYGEDDVQ